MIAAANVSYQPNQARLAENIKTVRLQVDVIIVVDADLPHRARKPRVDALGPATAYSR